MTVTCLPHVGSSVTERQIVINKFDNEEEMLKNYKLYMRFMEEWKEVSRFTDFLSSDIAQEDYRVCSISKLLVNY